MSACDDADCVGSGFRRIDLAYDGEGQRTGIVETPAVGSPVETTFRYQGDAIVAEDRDGNLYREYLTDEAGTISKVNVPVGQTGAGTYLVTWNGHGDAMALWRIETDGTLTLANSYTYSTWGLPTTATHNGIADLGFRFLYVGAADVQWDGTWGLPLIYMHARHYSPLIGRFLQPDPSRLDAKLFVYAENGPVTYVDPRGTVPDGAFRIYDRIRAFMLSELRANAFSSPLWNRITEDPANTGLLAFFAAKVRPKGSWDYKDRLAAMIGSHGKRDKVYYHSVRGKDYRVGLRWDFWGNFHYGYVGRSMGIPASTLRSANKIYGGINRPSDNVAIELGMEFWGSYGRAIDATLLQRKITGNWRRLVRAGATFRFL